MTERNAPRIAVLLPVFNNEAGLRHSLESLRQSTEPCDVIVVDDGSTPPVPPELAQIVSAGSVVLRLPRNQGAAAAAQAGLDYISAHGYEFVARLDSGDRVVPHRLALQLAFMNRRPELGLVASHLAFHDGAGKELFVMHVPHAGGWGPAEWLHVSNCLPHSSIFARTAALCAVGGYDPALEVAEDYDLLLRMAARYPIGTIPAVLVSSEWDPRGLTATRRRTMQRRRLALQWRHLSIGHPLHWYGLSRTALSLLMPSGTVFETKRFLHGLMKRLRPLKREWSPQ